MKVCCDSDFLIDLFNGMKRAKRVFEILNYEEKEFYTTLINVAELLSGAYRIENIEDRKIALITMWDFINQNFIVLEYGKHSKEFCEKYAEINYGLRKRNIQDTDKLTATISLINGIDTIITGNKEHYERIKDIKVIDYKKISLS